MPVQDALDEAFAITRARAENVPDALISYYRDNRDRIRDEHGGKWIAVVTNPRTGDVEIHEITHHGTLLNARTRFQDILTTEYGLLDDPPFVTYVPQ